MQIQLTKKRLITLLILAFLALVGLILNQLTPPPPPPVTPLPTPFPSPPPYQAQFSSLAPGYSQLDQVTKQLGQPLSSQETNNGTLYTFDSGNKYAPYQILTQETKVLFIKTPLIDLPQENMIQSLQNQYQESPTTLYGPESQSGINLYVFPHSGVALLATEKKGLGLELWYFSPTNIKNFINQWTPKYNTKPNPFLYHQENFTPTPSTGTQN